MLARSCVVLLLMGASCAHLLPASWKAFPVDVSLARPAIITALKAKHLPFLKDNPGETEISTEYMFFDDGATKYRERYRLSWEFDTRDKLLIIYARHEQNPEEYDGFARSWGPTSHDSDKESVMLDAIERALMTLHKATNPVKPAAKDAPSKDAPDPEG